MNRGGRIAARLALLAGSAVAGWVIMLDRIPVLATDMLFEAMTAAGARTNRLGPAVVRSARANKVPMANADILARSAMLDLSAGPLRFTGTPPGDKAAYWSVSVFAHNTDTLFVLNDRQVPPGRPVVVQLRLAHQPQPEAGVWDVVLPSPRGFLLVRPTMKDREDAAGVAALQAALADHRLEAWPSR